MINLKFYLILMTQFYIIGCSGQVNAKEYNETELPIKTATINTIENSDNDKLNQYKADKKVGKWKTYYENGQLKSEGYYIAGQKDGLHKEYENNGILLVEGFYTKGKANGLMKWFHERGHLLEKAIW